MDRRYVLHSVADGFYGPTCIQFLNQNKDIYVGDQIGIIYRIRDRKVTQYLDIKHKVGKLDEKYDERGLLSFCFHPNFDKDNSIFVFYTATQKSELKVIISRFYVSNSKDNQVDTDTEDILLEIPWNNEFPHHFGGRLAIRPSDGYLYITVGDAGPQEDPKSNAQNLSVLYGKILRIDIDTRRNKGYNVPPDNPFVAIRGVKEEIYAYGLRNPWAISFDKKDRCFVADVGYNEIEEINIIEKGANLGWNIYEGNKKTAFAPKVRNSKQDFSFPIYEYSHEWLLGVEGKEKGGVAIIGGYCPEVGTYIFGDYSGVLISIKEKANQTWKLSEIVIIDKTIRAFGQDSLGRIYVSLTDTTGVKKGEGSIAMIELK